GSDSVTFRPNLPQGGLYQVYVRWTANANRAENAPIDVASANGIKTFLVDQTQQGGQWVLLTTTNFAAGTNGFVRIRNDGTTGYVIADAVQLVIGRPTVSVWTADSQAPHYGPHSGILMIGRDSNSNDVLTVNLNIG